MLNDEWLTLLRPQGLVDCRRLYDDEARWHNLQLYLQQMWQVRPSVLLVGEAPGYRGCGATGVPFTSVSILEKHRFYATKPYRVTTDPLSKKEATATMVHDVVDGLGVRPLFWNAFPWHPHRPGEPGSNRRPTAAELGRGRPILVGLIDWFQIEQVIAVGKAAATTLGMAGVHFTAVRHPSFGGKAEFAKGVRHAVIGCDT